MGFIKKKTSSGWADAPVKVYTAAGWKNAPVSKFNGTKWEKLNGIKEVLTFDSTWTQTYRQEGTKRTDYRSEKLCQGKYVTDPWGIMRSLCGFNDASIRTALADATILKVELYLYAEHWYYYSGGVAEIGYHNHANKPSTFSHSKSDQAKEKFTARGQGKWIEIPISLGEGLRDNKYKGISIFSNTTNMNYYGVFSGIHDGSNKPKLRITIEK